MPAVTTWEKGMVKVDLDLLEDIWGGKEEKGVPHRVLDLPTGALWSNVAIEVGATGLRIEGAGHEVEVSFEAAGFGDRDQRLETLKCFAAGRGRLDRDRAAELLKGATPVKNRINGLRQFLRGLFSIDGDPIEYKRQAGIYVCSFKVQIEGAGTFPTPDGASWLNFEFAERLDKRLAVTVHEETRFRAGQRGQAEVAETAEPVTRIFALDDIGLRDDRGKLNSEGTALLELIRGGGKLKRAGDDLAVLRLGEWLRDWTGLTSNPLQYAERSGMWSANFDCRTEAE